MIVELLALTVSNGMPAMHRASSVGRVGGAVAVDGPTGPPPGEQPFCSRSGPITLVITITGPITGFGLVITIRLPRWYGNQDPDYLESGNQTVIGVIVITEAASPGGLISFN